MKKGNWSTILLVLVFLVGLSLLLYPTVSDYWNSLHQSIAVSDYVENVSVMDNEQYKKILDEAHAYNEALTARENPYALTGDLRDRYAMTLDPSGNGVMATVEIPSIYCTLPIYHGVDDAVLQVAIGHLDWSSLPVGGPNTHSVISGHRGLPSAKLFTNLDMVKMGDVFYIHVLDETLTYEVDTIWVVEPDVVASLTIEDGQDLVTLVTCTPYGINSHRLLVRGHRIETVEPEKSIRVSADAVRIDPVMVAPIVAAPAILVLLICVMVGEVRPRRR